MGVLTAVQRSEAIGKRVIRTRWVDRENDGRVKSELILKGFNRNHGRTKPEMFAPTPSTLSLKTMLAVNSHDRTMIQNVTTSQMQLANTQHSCTLTLTKSCLQSHQNLTNGMNQSCAKTKCGNCRKRCMVIAKRRNSGINMLLVSWKV